MKKVLSLLLALTMCVGLCVPAFAETENNDVSVDAPYGIAYEGDLFDGATLIGTEVVETETTYTTIKTYVRPNGSLVTDSLTVSKFSPLTPDGNDTVSRTVSSKGIATVTLTATFDWYKDNVLSYVRCTAAQANTVRQPGVKQVFVSTERTADYEAFKKAKATVSFEFSCDWDGFAGSLSIYCTNTGTISDSGGVAP